MAARLIDPFRGPFADAEVSDDELSDAELERLRLELDETNRGVLALYSELDAHARKLAEADRRKDEFLALLAHELRNPLAVARLALDELDDSEPANVLRRQVHHLSRLVDDLLEVSRIARGKIVLSLTPLDLVALVDETVRDREPVLASSGHRLEWAPPDEVLPVEADAVRLAQVVNNLLHNAAKYSPAGSTVRVEVERQGDEARLRVHDEGRGLTREERRRIFDLFVQTHADAEEDSGGLGIGLTLVRQLTRMQGGRVEVESAGRGEGSEFSVVLPLTDEPVRASVPHAAPRPIEGRRILLVEDEDDLRVLLAAKLRRRGIDVDTAEDAHSALGHVEERPYDAILSDLGLPGMNGYELARELRSRCPGVPLVALSGYGSERDRDRSRRAGFARHLVKPLALEEIVETLTGVWSDAG